MNNCQNCNNWTDGNKIEFEIDPMGEWAWCKILNKKTHEDDTCYYHSPKEKNIDEKLKSAL